MAQRLRAALSMEPDQMGLTLFHSLRTRTEPAPKICSLNLLSFNKRQWTKFTKCMMPSNSMSTIYEAVLFLSRMTNMFWKWESALVSGSYPHKYSSSITDEIHIMDETSMCVLGFAELLFHYCIKEAYSIGHDKGVMYCFHRNVSILWS